MGWRGAFAVNSVLRAQSTPGAQAGGPFSPTRSMGSCGGQAVGRVSVKGVGLSVLFLRRTATSKPFNLIIAVINIRLDSFYFVF